jgi:hypothetical protein
MLNELTRLARPYFVLLAIVTVGRLLLGVFGVPYAQGTNTFSIVTLTLMASLFSTIFVRRWLGWRLGQAAAFGAYMAVCSQIVIWLLTALSYGLGLHTYFNDSMAISRRPEALAFLPAMGFRAVGLVVNTLLNAIAGSLGWAFGGLLPKRQG